MSNQLATQSDAAMIESVVIGGDLSKLTPEQRVSYYMQVCKSLGLNPLTKPFDYINLNGRLTLYARKDAADQLRQINGISIEKPDITFQDDWIIVTVAASNQNGRKDSDVGVVNKKDMRGDFGNALMKAVTKAKRRVTLSICGLGMLDETEIETIPTAKPVIVAETGEIVDTQAVPVHDQPENKPAQPEAIGPLFDGIPDELAQYMNVLADDGTPYPMLQLKELTIRYNSLDKALKANGLTDEQRKEKTRKHDAADAIIRYYRAHTNHAA